MVKFGIIDSPVDAEHPQTSSYKSIEIAPLNFPMNSNLISFGNPLWEEKPTEIILSYLESEHRFEHKDKEDEPLFAY